MGVVLNFDPKETLADGISILEGAALEGSHRPNKIAKTDQLRSEFTIDLLDGCEFSCPGCYVQKRTKVTPQDLEDCVQIMGCLKGMDISCEDLFIGPTDIFSANNLEGLMQDDNMYKLTGQFAVTCTSTLMSDPDSVKRKWDIVQDHLTKAPARDFDILVVLNEYKFLRGDVEYMTRLETNLKNFEHDTVYFMMNYDGDMLQIWDLNALSKKVKDTFNAPLRMNPSFLRVGSPRVVQPKAKAMIKMLEDNQGEHVVVNMFDKYFNGDGFVNLSFRKHELYATPFIYEGVPQTHEIFRIPRTDGRYTPEAINDKFRALTTRQFAYAANTAKDCASCENLTSCISRKVLAYMESRDFSECIVPRKLIRDPFE